MPPPPPSSTRIPPLVWTTLVGLMSAATAFLYAQAKHEPDSAPRHSAQPADPLPPLGAPDKTPTTDDGVIAARVLEGKLNALLADQNARIVVLETRVCLLEQELREAEARHVALAAGKRAKSAREAFEQRTAKWSACSVDIKDVRERPSLREVLDSVLFQ